MKQARLTHEEADRRIGEALARAEGGHGAEPETEAAPEPAAAVARKKKDGSA
jgi:hypothetical protein